ncbi:MAG TPA: DMT family transporter [Solirubrobacterales bacterium]|nr:DMT family transporter [Solirubrobacterales bacterium]
MDGELALGFALALAAACCYETGYALQALEARRAPPERALRPSLVGHLLRRPVWVGGIALALLGWPLQIAALSQAPLTLVQPVLALGLLLLLALGVRVLGESVGPREVLAVVLIIGSVAVFAWAAPRDTADVERSTGLVVALASLIGVTLAPYAISLVRRSAHPMLLLVASAGAADGLAAFVAKIVAQDASDGALVGVVLWAGLVAAVVIIGLISESTALQRFAATRVAPTVLVMQIVIPVVLAPLVGGEGWGDTPLGGAVLGAALVAIALGAGLLASSPAVAQLAVGEAESPEHD